MSSSPEIPPGSGERRTELAGGEPLDSGGNTASLAPSRRIPGLLSAGITALSSVEGADEGIVDANGVCPGSEVPVRSLCVSRPGVELSYLGVAGRLGGISTVDSSLSLTLADPTPLWRLRVLGLSGVDSGAPLVAPSPD